MSGANGTRVGERPSFDECPLIGGVLLGGTSYLVVFAHTLRPIRVRRGSARWRCLWGATIWCDSFRDLAQQGHLEVRLLLLVSDRKQSKHQRGW